MQSTFIGTGGIQRNRDCRPSLVAYLAKRASRYEDLQLLSAKNNMGKRCRILVLSMLCNTHFLQPERSQGAGSNVQLFDPMRF